MASFIDVYKSACSESKIEPRDQVLAAALEAETTGTFTLHALELSGNSKELFSNRLTNADVNALVTAICKGGLVVEGLFLCYNHISDEGAASIARLFLDTDAYTCTLKSLDLRGNSIGTEGCRAIMAAAIDSRNRSLIRLNLNGNPIGNDGGMAVAEFLEANRSLDSLDLGSTELETEALVAIATVVSSNNVLRSLVLDNPRTFSRMEDTMYHVARMLRANSTLTHLSLAKNSIGDFGAKLLAEYLGDNSTLVYLNLRCNGIAGTGGEALAGLVVRGSLLEEINLEANRIGDEGAKAWAVALRRSTALRVLNIKHNSIKNDGLVAVASAFEENRTLCELHIWGNEFGQESKDAFAHHASRSFPSFGLEIDIRPYVVDGVVQVAQQDV